MSLSWLLCFAPAACGGIAQRESGDSQTPAESESADDRDGRGSTKAPEGRVLGDCKLGPLEHADYDAPCAWVADRRCYVELDMACNCTCPRSKDSQCVSGFEAGPTGHVWVSCE